MEERIITPEEFAECMQRLQDRLNDPKESLHYDKELTHMSMDDLMCETLRELGYEKGIDIFEETEKWYA